MKLLSVLIIVLLASPGWAYTEQPVANGGHVSGKVILKGSPPPPKAFNLITYPEPVFCGRISTGTAWRLLEQFHVAPDGGLQVRFEFENATDRRMAHTKMVENPHFGIGTLDTFGERIIIQPTHQIQAP